MAKTINTATAIKAELKRLGAAPLDFDVWGDVTRFFDNQETSWYPTATALEALRGAEPEDDGTGDVTGYTGAWQALMRTEAERTSAWMPDRAPANGEPVARLVELGDDARTEAGEVKTGEKLYLDSGDAVAAARKLWRR